MSQKAKVNLAGMGPGLAIFGGVGGGIAGATDNWVWAVVFVILGAFVGLGIGHGM